MYLNWVVPWIDVVYHPAVVGQIPRGAEEDPTQVHQLAEREISEQHADQEKVDVKHHAEILGDNRAET